MKKSLTEYASALSNSRMEVLEELICKKYRKFIRFFRLMKDYSEYITKLDYEFTDKDTLSINVSFKKSIKLDEKIELIEEMEEQGYNISFKIKGKQMKLVIVHEE